MSVSYTHLDVYKRQQLAVNRLRSKMLTQAGREFIHLAQELFHD